MFIIQYTLNILMVYYSYQNSYVGKLNENKKR
ncbi:MAG: hypothetical protein ACI81I_000840 [Arcobacteraceae bacterium]